MGWELRLGQTCGILNARLRSLDIILMGKRGGVVRALKVPHQESDI